MTPIVPHRERIELAGPAGCGKTSAFRELESLLPVRPGVVPCDASCVPIALRLLSLLPPGYVAGELGHGRLPREVLRSMVYLETWQPWRSTESPDGGSIVYDHGPFFRLATLDGLGLRRAPRFDRWWRSMRDAWTGATSLVVRLDAPESLLLERIRRRERKHPCQTMDDATAFEWLGRYRQAIDGAIALLEQLRPEDVLRIDSSRQSPREIAERIAAEIERRRA